MRDRREVDDLGTVLGFLRALRGWSQEDLAAAAGLRQSTVSELEQGKKIPKPATRARLLAALDFSPRLVEGVRCLLCALGTAVAAGDLPAAASLDEEIEALAAEFGNLQADLARAALPLMVEDLRRRAPREPSAAQLADPARAREEAAALWRRLEPYTASQRQALVHEGEEFRGWALGERLCAESLRRTAESVVNARELAELAVLVADLLDNDEPLRSRLQGCCGVHLGNALRAGGDLEAAKAAFAQGLPLWRDGATGDRGGLLDEARVLGLEASLRRDQRLLPEALALLDRALTLDRGEERCFLLLNRAKTLEEAHAFDAAIASLQEALPLLAEGHDPRLLWIARFNLLELLEHAGCLDEAEPLVAEVAELAPRYAAKLDRIRVRWLAGRIAAARGRADEALALLREVRAGFAAEKIPYDTALVTLELAALLAERGATAEVKTLARQLAPVFRALGVGREMLASLALFQRAAEQEVVTAALARRLAEELRRVVRAPASSRCELPA
ncbi:MAG TPA: helix-turn-helix transcriptional regulator [Thermoanaerobaculia bacterium]|nr:helix-turn-helix transcriptional regulator [Thermoanaerobaculia bacterium]